MLSTEQEIILPYQDRYLHGLAKTEDKAAPVRRSLMVAHKIAPQKTLKKMAAAESIYTYMRILDALADEHPDVQPVWHILHQENTALQEHMPPTMLQEQFLTEPLLTYPPLYPSNHQEKFRDGHNGFGNRPRNQGYPNSFRYSSIKN